MENLLTRHTIIEEDNVGEFEYIEYLNILRISEEKGSGVLAVDDLIYILKKMKVSDKVKIVSINNIYVNEDMRNKGITRVTIQNIVKGFNDYLIISPIGISNREYPDYPDNDKMNNILNNLYNNIYSKAGFENVNKYIGRYDDRITTIYKNEIGKEVIKFIKSNVDIK